MAIDPIEAGLVVLSDLRCLLKNERCTFTVHSMHVDKYTVNFYLA